MANQHWVLSLHGKGNPRPNSVPLLEEFTVVQFGDLTAAAGRGDWDFILQHADLLLIQGDCPSDRVGWAFYLKSSAAMELDRPVLAIAAGEQALTWAEQNGDADLQARTRISLGYSMVRLGRVAEAADLLEGYLAGLSRHPSWQRFECTARFNLGVAYRHSGRLTDAVREYKMALDVPETQPGLYVQIRQNLAWALILLGDSAGAAEQLQAVAENVRATLSLGRLTSYWVDQAALHLLEGDTKAARTACQQVLDALDEKQRAAHLATTYVTLGRIALAEGDRTEVQRCSMLARTHAEKAERWDLHNEGTRLWVSAMEKGVMEGEENALAAAARLLVVGRSSR